MGTIKKIKEYNIIGGDNTQTDIYPITSTKAVFDRNNISVEDILDNDNDILFKQIAGTSAATGMSQKAITDIFNTKADFDAFKLYAEQHYNAVIAYLKVAVNAADIETNLILEPLNSVYYADSNSGIYAGFMVVNRDNTVQGLEKIPRVLDALYINLSNNLLYRWNGTNTLDLTQCTYELVDIEGTSNTKIMSQKGIKDLIDALKTGDIATLQADIQNLEANKVNKTDILNTRGQATDKVLSQKAITDELVTIDNSINTNATNITTLTNNKFDKASIEQVTGTNTDKVISQKGVTDLLTNVGNDLNTKVDKSDITDVLGPDSTKVMSQKGTNDAIDNLKNGELTTLFDYIQQLDSAKYDNLNVKQTTGQSKVYVMSQKATSDELSSLSTQLNSLDSAKLSNSDFALYKQQADVDHKNIFTFIKFATSVQDIEVGLTSELIGTCYYAGNNCGSYAGNLVYNIDGTIGNLQKISVKENALYVKSDTNTIYRWEGTLNKDLINVTVEKINFEDVYIWGVDNIDKATMDNMLSLYGGFDVVSYKLDTGVAILSIHSDGYRVIQTYYQNIDSDTFVVVFTGTDDGTIALQQASLTFNRNFGINIDSIQLVSSKSLDTRIVNSLAIPYSNRAASVAAVNGGLDTKLNKSDFVQTLGTSTTAIVSQNGITEELNKKLYNINLTIPFELYMDGESCDKATMDALLLPYGGFDKVMSDLTNGKAEVYTNSVNNTHYFMNGFTSLSNDIFEMYIIGDEDKASLKHNVLIFNKNTGITNYVRQIALLDSSGHIPEIQIKKNDLKVEYVNTLPVPPAANTIYFQDNKLWDHTINNVYIDVTNNYEEKYQLARLLLQIYSKNFVVDEENHTVYDTKRNTIYPIGIKPNSDYTLAASEVEAKDGETISYNSTEVLSNGETIQKFEISQKIVGNTYTNTFTLGVDENGDKFFRLEDSNLKTASKQVVGAINENYENSKVSEFTEEYPTVIPTHLGKRGIDTKKRFYDAVGTGSLLDWEIAKSIGARGVKTENVNLYTPSNVNRTFEFLFKSDATQGVNRHFQISDGTNSNRVIFYTNDNLLVFTQAYENTNIKVLSYTNRKLIHCVISNINNIVNVWINNELVVDNYDYSAHQLISIDNYCQNASTFVVREHNFKPSNEQVREWYNTGRVDRYELPTELKQSDARGLFNKQILGQSAIIGNDADLILAQLVGGRYEFIRTSTENSYIKLNVDLKKGHSYQLVCDIQSVDGYALSYYVKAGNINLGQRPIVNGVFSFKVNEDSQGLFIFNNGVNNAYSLTNFEVIECACLHEYKDTNVQPHKLVDTGATPGDKLLNWATPTFEPPYQEFISAEGAPTVIPQIEQQSYEDLTNKNLYKSVGTSSASDWKKINN